MTPRPPSRSGGGARKQDEYLPEILLGAALLSLLSHYALWRAVVWGWLL